MAVQTQAVPKQKNKTLQVQREGAYVHFLEMKTQATKAFSQYYIKHILYILHLVKDSQSTLIVTQK